MGSLLLALAGCNFINPDKDDLNFSVSAERPIVNPIKTQTDDSNEKDLVYLDLKAKIFKESCIVCHNPEKPARLDLTNKELILDNYEDIIYRMTKSFDDGYNKMPPNGKQVSPELINQLKAWKADAGFANIQAQLFAKKCTTCHKPGNTRGLLDLTSKEVVLDKFDTIIYSMTDAFRDQNKPMPPKGSRVSVFLIKELKAWKESL